MTELDVGQVWVCASVEGTPPLMCIIGRLDQLSVADVPVEVVSVCIAPHPEAKKAGWPTISHMPVSMEAFLSSGLRLAQEGAVLGADFEDGYAQWRSAFDDRKAGVFSINISEAYAGVIGVAKEQ